MTFVGELHRRFWDEENTAAFELDLQAFLIHGFNKPATFVAINLETCAVDGVAFLLENKISPHTTEMCAELDENQVWRNYLLECGNMSEMTNRRTDLTRGIGATTECTIHTKRGG